MTIQLYNRHSGQPVYTKWISYRLLATCILMDLEAQCEGTDYAVRQLD